MSKLYSMYLSLKEQNPDSLFLFKSGIFLIALDKDAIKLSDLFGLKLTKLNDSVQKCGFPSASFEKYTNLFKALNLDVKIIEVDKNTSYGLREYKQDKAIEELLELIKNVDKDNLSVSQAYEFIESLKSKVNNILE